MEIRPLDPHDDAEAAAWYAALHAGAAHGRTAPIVVSATALLMSLRTAADNPVTARHPYGAWDGDACVGTLLVDLPLAENTHIAEVEVNIPPEHRRRGVGAALFDTGVGIARDNGRTLLADSVNVPVDAALDTHPGGRFALARGFVATHTEQHLVLDVPLPEERLAVLAGTVGGVGGADQRSTASDGYATVTWPDVVPDERAADLAALLTGMAVDVPTGESDREPAVYDAERVLRGQRRSVEQGFHLVTTLVLDPAGAPAGYTVLYVTADGVEVLQDATFVLAVHRGRGLGARAKAANLRALAAGHPGTRHVHTWTAGVNDAMQAVNARFGFRAVETMYEMEAAL